jgi:hypothetical protein
VAHPHMFIYVGVSKITFFGTHYSYTKLLLNSTETMNIWIVIWYWNNIM